MAIELLLALRFLRGSQSEKNIAFMIKICFATICASSFILTLITAIMAGFERETHKKLQNMHSDIIIKSPVRALNYPKLDAVLKQEFTQFLSAWSPSTAGQVIMRVKTNNQERQFAIILKAIEPAHEQHVSSLHTMIISPPHIAKLDFLNQPNTILIGAIRARNSELKVGDSVELLFPAQSSNSQKITLDNRIVTVAGIFKTGIAEFDEHLAYCSLPFMQELLNIGITEVNAKLKNPEDEQKVLTHLKKRLPLTIISWKELYPALLSALALEKYVVIFILALLIILACINIMALIFMFITHKQTDIALLTTQGMPRAKINRIFLIVGLIITMSGAFAGLASALLVALVLAYYPIALPSAYQTAVINYLPIYLNVSHIVFIMVIIVILSVYAVYIPVKSIKKLSPLAGLKRI